MKFIRLIVGIALANLFLTGTFLVLANYSNVKNMSPEPITENQNATETQVPTSAPPQKIKTPPVQTPPKEPLTDRCIIVVRGEKYDVTNFKINHSGGDVFICGTDMTAIFFGQHDEARFRSPEMQALKVP